MVLFTGKELWYLLDNFIFLCLNLIVTLWAIVGITTTEASGSFNKMEEFRVSQRDLASLLSIILPALLSIIF